MNAQTDTSSAEAKPPIRDLTALPAACFVGESDTVIWFKRPEDRLRRALTRLGVDRFVDATALGEETGAVLVAHAGAVIDAPLVEALLNAPGAVLLTTGPGEPVPIAVHAPAGSADAARAVLRDGRTTELPSGLRAVRATELGGSYWAALRKREEPYALLPETSERHQVEWRVFMGTYKGATDLVTKWLWPWPAFHATRFCARLGVTPNKVTALSLVLVIAAFYWFWIGEWALGLCAAWFMTFLDTVDGKLARVTLQSSRFGNVFDHGIDLIHPPFWYVAWAVGVQSGPLALEAPVLTTALAVIVGGYVLQRLIEGVAIWRFRLEIHVWRRIDTWLRLVTARRNPNLLLLTGFALIGRVDWGLIAVAIWTAICLGLHGLQLVQAFMAVGPSGTLRSWMQRTD